MALAGVILFVGGVLLMIGGLLAVCAAALPPRPRRRPALRVVQGGRER